MMTDPIADMLTRIRNANQRKLPGVVMGTSKLKVQIARILRNEGYIKGYKVFGTAPHRKMSISLKYHGPERQQSMLGLKRISKPGLRVYAKSQTIPKVLNGLGIAIISTSKGIITDQEARAHNLGGEVLAYIW